MEDIDSNNKIQMSEFENRKPKKFIENINKLKIFSENVPTETNLPTVPVSGGLFGVFDYKVTGDDLNELIKKVQGIVINQNKSIHDIFGEFNTVYNVFSSLDNEYIKGIIGSIKAAEKANERALIAIEGVRNNQIGIKKSQNDIEDIIKYQQIMIGVLTNFKEKLEKFEHLSDVDKVFNEVLILKDKLIKIENKFISEVKLANNKFIEIESWQLQQQEEFKKIILFQNQIDKKNQDKIEELNCKCISCEEKLNIIINTQVRNKEDYETTIGNIEVRTINLTKKIKSTQYMLLASISIIVVLILFIFTGGA